jgi:hypothetical protein
MRRRNAIGATIIPLAAVTVTQPACSDRKPSTKAEPVTLPPFSSASLHQRLDELLSAHTAKAPKIRQYMQPGLSETQILGQTAWFPKQLPRQIISLYQWRNGFFAPNSTDVPQFQFRDYTFLPLQEIEKEYRSMNDTYGKIAPDTDLLASSFPFATLGEGWLVVSATKPSIAPQFERPVISVFQGVSVFFYSMEKMAETCTEWLAHPKHNGLSIPRKDELEVWRRVNPGIFQ